MVYKLFATALVAGVVFVLVYRNNQISIEMFCIRISEIFKNLKEVFKKS